MLISEKKLESLYTMSDVEKIELLDVLSKITNNPYSEYKEFSCKISSLIKMGSLPDFFINLCNKIKNMCLVESPFVFIKNCPIDIDLPIFNNVNPVEEKYKLKKTFIAEAFLELYAQLTSTIPVGYKNVNSGDIFQDIYPMDKLSKSQSQKTLIAIGFHKDLANHFVRPDWVNILCMRANDQNIIPTTFVKNIDIVNHLDADTISILREKQFYTPYDDLTVYGDTNEELGKANEHAILYDQHNIAYFENRTIGHNDKAQKAIVNLNKILHEVKYSINMMPGYFVAIANNYSLHGKDVVSINNPVEQKRRWMIKTVNLSHIEPYQDKLMNNKYRVING